MKRSFRHISILLLAGVLFVVSCKTKVNEQQTEQTGLQPAFWNDIQAFKEQDSISPAPENAILFIGSSSFTLWRDVQDYFPGHKIINRGFGSSTLVNQIYYANDIIFPYQPKQIVIYCGENDIAFSDTVTAEIVFERFKQLFQLIREKTEVPVIYISMKPSPSRRVLIPEMRKANQLIKDFIATQTNILYLDVHSLMLDERGEPLSEIFVDDSLHMNAKGYTIWQKAITPHLLKD